MKMENIENNNTSQSSKSKGRFAKAGNALVPVNNRISVIIDDLIGKAAPKMENPADVDLAEYSRLPIRYGLWLFTLFFIFCGGWSLIKTMPVGPIATGQVVVESSRKTVQHLEGGIIEEIMVKDGDIVEAGAPLIRLRETNPQTRLDIVLGQYYADLAMESRLVAERDGLEEIKFSPELELMKNSTQIKEIVGAQNNLFRTRKESVDGQVRVLNQRIEQLKDQINGMKAQVSSSQSQNSLINEEISTVKTLLASGNANKPRLLGLQRLEAGLKGDIGKIRAEIAKAQQTITEAELQIINTKNEFQNTVAKELRDVQVRLSDLREQKTAIEDVVSRTVIKANQSGVVTGLKYHTVGGVISPATPIMDIVPQNDKMVVDAQIRPQDIDVMRPGLDARVRLTPYKSRRIPALDGKVVEVSPDIFQDQRNGMSYYTSRIEIDAASLAAIKGESVKLYPGMPVEIRIVVGDNRSLFSYLTSPIQDSFFNAFSEE